MYVPSAIAVALATEELERSLKELRALVQLLPKWETGKTYQVCGSPTASARWASTRPEARCRGPSNPTSCLGEGTRKNCLHADCVTVR